MATTANGKTLKMSRCVFKTVTDCCHFPFIAVCIRMTAINLINSNQIGLDCIKCCRNFQEEKKKNDRPFELNCNLHSNLIISFYLFNVLYKSWFLFHRPEFPDAEYSSHLKKYPQKQKKWGKNARKTIFTMWHHKRKENNEKKIGLFWNSYMFLFKTVIVCNGTEFNMSFIVIWR